MSLNSRIESNKEKEDLQQGLTMLRSSRSSSSAIVSIPSPAMREFIDYKTSMITDKETLRRLLF